jgi:penicillin G amidase
MSSKWISFIISLTLTASLAYTLNTRIGSTPPLGKFLDPVDGVWRNALIKDIPPAGTLQIPGLREQVQVVYNQRGVPHIFALNDHDLHLAAGYVTARHRLWQMEFSTFASAGRISEIVGSVALGYDRHQRRIGMQYGAEQVYALIESDPWSNETVQAYSKGVNAWINQLTQATLPVEYKLLDYRPEPWTASKTAIFYMNMNQTLTSGTSALPMTYVLELLGEGATNLFYPTYPAGRNEPIISENTPWRFSATRRTPPESTFIPTFVTDTSLPKLEEGVGSNNWAISGQKTASGAAMMATDPHLTLSLPSIWYEAQYNAPGVNVYGITLPGVPAVIMGFNEYIAWGNTNSGAAALDIFEIELNAERSAYWHDNQWLPLTPRIEILNIRGGESVIDTVYYTHHGPLAYLSDETSFDAEIPVGHAVQWIAHNPTNPLRSFFQINRARDIGDFRKGLETLHAPTQNYVFASVDGDIAMQINGLHPIRWEHHGKFINDGRDPAYNWDGFIPFDQLPSQINPARGFVSSANQHPTSSSYPYYLGWSFAAEARGSIINRTLENLQNATYRDMIALQMNSDNYWADYWLDRMLGSLDTWHTNTTDDTETAVEMSPLAASMIDSLQSWDRVNHSHSLAATVFNTWIDQIEQHTWSDIFAELDRKPSMLPPLNTTMEVVFNGYGIDEYIRLNGAPVQTSELLTKSLNAAVAHLQAKYGDPGANWHWWKQNGSTINHLLNIQALNEPRLAVSGSNMSPNAIRNRHGPSWRMVAEMTQPVQAWGIYPGGQSGNPATRGYNAFISDWAQGNHYQLKLYRDAASAAAEHNHVLTLTPIR